MWKLESILTLLAALGVGSILPTLAKAFLDYLRGRTQADLSITLADNERDGKTLARLEQQVDNLLADWMAAKEEITQINVDKLIAQYQFTQANKRIEELEKKLKDGE